MSLDNVEGSQCEALLEIVHDAHGFHHVLL